MFEYHEVPKHGVETLAVKLKKINKKADKIGVPQLDISISDVYYIRDPEQPELAYVKDYIEVYDVVITGDLPQYDNWSLMATVEGYPNGQNILYKNPMFIKIHGDIDVTEYRDGKSFCDHCGTSRYRKNTYLVYNNKTEEIKQVGSSCIKDFLGHDVPSFSYYGKLLKELEDIDVHSGGGSGKSFINLYDFILYSNAIIDRYGFIGKEKARDQEKTATVEYVTDELFSIKNRNKHIHIDKITAKDHENTQKIIEWGQSLQNRDNLNDYMYNLSVIFNNGYVERRGYGLATAAVFTYKYEMGEYEKKKFEKKTSNYVGQVKEKITVDVNIAKIMEINGAWGITYMHIMFDDDGNQFVWFGSKGLYINDECAEIGDKVKITATVKQHKDYNGTKQTVLTRCKLKEIIAVKGDI